MKRMAPADPFRPAPRSRDHPVLFYGLDVVVTAGWLKSALPPNDWTESPLIDPHQPNRDIRRQKPQPVQHGFHLEVEFLIIDHESYEYHEWECEDRAVYSSDGTGNFRRMYFTDLASDCR